MIILLRVYKDGRVIAAETYDHDEVAPDHRHPLERCRCLPRPLWQKRQYDLTQEHKGCKVTTTSIYR